MSTYHLKIVTPEKVKFDGEAESLVARTVTGDVCILARHTEYIAPLAIGQVRVKSDGKVRKGAVNAGTLIVTGGEASIITNAFEWEDEIDLERANEAKKRAEEKIAHHETDFELQLAEIKLKRAINRIKLGGR